MRRLLRRHHRRHAACVGGRAATASDVGVARSVDRVRRRCCLMLGVARLSRPLRAAVRGPHDLRRRHLHRRARHADRPADRLDRARASARCSRSSTPSPRRGCAGWSRRSRPPPSATSSSACSAGTSTASSSSRTSWCARQPFIAHNIEMTRQAYALDRIAQHPFPADTRRRGGRRGAQPGRRCRTSGCGTGARCRTRCGRFRKSAPTTTSRTSTSIAIRSTARCGR